jgi:antitoxin component HigA of HigAB toxin-antitoxin module
MPMPTCKSEASFKKALNVVKLLLSQHMQIGLQKFKNTHVSVSKYNVVESKKLPLSLPQNNRLFEVELALKWDTVVSKRK